MPYQDERAASIARLRDLTRGIEIAMLTTVGHDGALHSRPMATQDMEFDGTLWFLTGQDTAKAGEVAEYRAVNVAYTHPDDHRYVSMSGAATLVRDAARAARLWRPAYRVWFPQGLDDPNLVLLRVQIDGAEYWDQGTGRMQPLAGFDSGARATSPQTNGDHDRVILDTSGN